MERKLSDEEDLLRLLRSLAGDAVLYVGDIPSEVLAAWPNRVTSRVIITAERRQHYLMRHPEMEKNEHQLIRLIHDPEFALRDSKDPDTVVLLMAALDSRHDIVAVIKIATADGLDNSVLSVRMQEKPRKQAGLRGGYCVWMK